MNRVNFTIARLFWFAAALLSGFRTDAGSVQTASLRSAAIAAPASADGDSIAPIISADGRYVLFASSADNLVVNSNGSAVFGPTPAPLNVYLRDRTNHTTTLLSVNTSGTGGGNADSIPVEISADNRFALFESSASNLVNNDSNNASDIFVRDLTLGVTWLVSASTNGGVANGASRSSTMTPNGRYVAFVSAANNLVSSDTNGIADIFVRDLQSGSTACASRGAIAASPASGSESPMITPDGRYVAFYSTATGLVSGGSTSGDIYLRDMIAGQTFLASTNARTIATPIFGSSTTLQCYGPALSDDGHFVIYKIGRYFSGLSSGALIFRYNLLTGLTDIAGTSAAYDPGFDNARSLDVTPDGRFVVYIAGKGTNVYLWDGQSNTTTLVSADLTQAAPVGAICEWPVVDATGRYVTFFSTASNLTTNILTGDYNLYVRDVQAATTLLVNAGAGGAGTVLNPATYPSLSSNAQLIAFECRDSTLVTNDNNRFYDVFVRDLVAGTNELISAHYPGLPTVTPDALSSISLLSLSSNGQFLAFSSLADDLALYDTNGFRDIFFRDLIAGTNQLVSINTNGTGSGNSSSREPAISGNGRFVAFTSRASDLVAGDATNFSDVFVRDTLAGTTTLASVSTNGTAPGNNSSFSPVISTDGRYVMFHSQANNLAPGFSGGTVDSIFVRDLQAATTVALNTNTSSGNSLAAMTPDGRHVVYTASASIAQNLYVYDAQIGKRVYTNFVANAAVVGLSPNGNRIAYANSSQLLVADLVAHTNGMIGTTLGTTRSALRFSGDGRFLAYATTNAVWATDTNKVTDIYLYDFQLQTNLLISRSFSSGRAANGPSDSPDVSSDGRFIAYRSSASDIVPGDTNGVPDIFLYDRVLNTTRLITATPSGTSVANARSTTPVFSGDAQSLAFESWAANLTALDYNQSADVFLLVLSSSTITDSDGDGMDDAWEIQYFSTLDRDGTSDSDGDGVSDLVEFQTGTDPKDPASFFHVEVVSLGGPGQGATISWPATSGKTYQAQYKNSLNDSNWQNLSGNVVFVGNKGYANDPSPGGTQRFYRVVLSN